MALVLYYHQVRPFAPGHPRKNNVEPAVFRKQIELLANRYRLVTLDDLIESNLKDGAAITFDDGFKSVIENALPILNELHIRATLFVIANGADGRPTTNVDYQALAHWDDLKRWVDAGHLIGSHGLSHTPLDTMPTDQARSEVFESKRTIADKLGIAVNHFAYPQGMRTPEVVRFVQEAGYQAGWAAGKGTNDRWQHRRIRTSANDHGLRWRWKLKKVDWGLY